MCVEAFSWWVDSDSDKATCHSGAKAVSRTFLSLQAGQAARKCHAMYVVSSATACLDIVMFELFAVFGGFPVWTPPALRACT